MSIVGAEWVMFHDHALPLHLWAEACNTTIWLQNKSPHPILGMSTLEENFLGKKPYVRHFKIFHSLVYSHVTKYAQKKLEPTPEFGIFLAYTDTPHNYQVYLLTNKMTVVQRDVKFDQDKTMRSSLERELQLHVVEELLAPKEEHQDDVEQPHVEEQEVEAPTLAQSSRNGRKLTIEAWSTHVTM